MGRKNSNMDAKNSKVKKCDIQKRTMTMQNDMCLNDTRYGRGNNISEMAKFKPYSGCENLTKTPQGAYHVTDTLLKAWEAMKVCSKFGDVAGIRDCWSIIRQCADEIGLSIDYIMSNLNRL